MEKYKAGFRRIIAAILDGMLLALPMVILTSNIDNTHLPPWLIPLFNTVFPIVYSVGMHTQFGQTLGKMTMDVQVVNVHNEGAITITQAILRDSVWIGLQIIGILSLLLLQEESNWFGWIKSVTDNIAFLWTVTEIISMFANSRYRSVHDLIAGTVVIKVAKMDKAAPMV